MCLIIANPDGREIPLAYIINAYSNNADGFGIMFPKDGTLRIKRGLFTISQIVEVFDEIESAKVPYVAHFRFSTRGVGSAENCHPFPITTSRGGVGMVHNGTLTGNQWRHGKKSDTALLAEKIGNHLDRAEFSVHDLFRTEVPVLRQRYLADIGTDKLVFMDGNGKINIYNRHQGIEYDDVWYSNGYSLTPESNEVQSWENGKWKSNRKYETTLGYFPALERLIAE